jgi:hypothetical protein
VSDVPSAAPGEPAAGNDIWLQLARHYEIAGRRAPLDVWLVLACAAFTGLLCGWVAFSAFKAGFPAISGEFAFLGVIVVLVGVMFAGLTYAYGWVAARLFAQDPVARWLGVTLGATVALALLSSQAGGAGGALAVLTLLANVVIVVLVLLGPGVRTWIGSGRFGDVPETVAAAAALARVFALAATLTGLILLAGGKYDSKLAFFGLLVGGAGDWVGFE